MKKYILTIGLISLLLTPAAWAKIGAEDITFMVSNAGDVVYNHDVHVEKLGLGCSECHYRVFARAAHNIRDKATMTEMQNGKSCGSCHNGRRAFGVDKNCSRCHQNYNVTAAQ